MGLGRGCAEGGRVPAWLTAKPPDLPDPAS